MWLNSTLKFQMFYDEHTFPQFIIKKVGECSKNKSCVDKQNLAYLDSYFKSVLYITQQNNCTASLCVLQERGKGR